MPKMNPVQSSNVHSVGYDPDTRTAHVRFHNGRTYAYDGVSQDDFDDLQNASSVGSAVHDFKTKYTGRMV